MRRAEISQQLARRDVEQLVPQSSNCCCINVSCGGGVQGHMQPACSMYAVCGGSICSTTGDTQSTGALCLVHSRTSANMFDGFAGKPPPSSLLDANPHAFLSFWQASCVPGPAHSGVLQ
uniref:Uncharacterized protein n=1 Tax=Eutreptiella gymnastica TaxID=73025 RepID=A0A7S4C8R2_9EUGL